MASDARSVPTYTPGECVTWRCWGSIGGGFRDVSARVDHDNGTALVLVRVLYRGASVLRHARRSDLTRPTGAT